MSTSTNRLRSLTAPVVLALALLAGCGGGSSTGTPAIVADAGVQAGLQLLQGSRSPDGLDRCALLKDEEIGAAIGAHGPSGLGTKWGRESCRWESTIAQHMGDSVDWYDSIELAVFSKERESWAREQAEGYPVEGFVPDALYNPTHGELWFDCGGSRFCAIKARTRSGRNREQIARQLAQLVVTRLH